MCAQLNLLLARTTLRNTSSGLPNARSARLTPSATLNSSTDSPTWRAINGSPVTSSAAAHSEILVAKSNQLLSCRSSASRSAKPVIASSRSTAARPALRSR